MFNMNYVIFAFSLTTTLVILVGTLVNFFEDKIPAFIANSVRYGKFDCKEKRSFLSKLMVDIPKYWFRHFYLLALICYTFAFALVTAVYFKKCAVPVWITNLLDVTCGKERISFVSSTQVYVALCLMTLQVFRRFYDTHYVSIFSKQNYIKLHQYVIGLLFYPGTILAIICEAPKFAQTSTYAVEEIDFSSISYFEMFAVVLFLWAWWHQFKTTEILANLRKNQRGKIVTNEHRLPYGDWFEYISSPPQAAEILMYSALTIILRYNITWFFIYAWVVVNQVETMLLSHWWYQETFKDIPKKRKAIIPFIY